MDSSSSPRPHQAPPHAHTGLRVAGYVVVGVLALLGLAAVAAVVLFVVAFNSYGSNK